MIKPKTFESDGSDRYLTHAPEMGRVVEALMAARSKSGIYSTTYADEIRVDNAVNNRGYNPTFLTDFDVAIKGDILYINQMRGYVAGRYFEIENEEANRVDTRYGIETLYFRVTESQIPVELNNRQRADGQINNGGGLLVQIPVRLDMVNKKAHQLIQTGGKITNEKRDPYRLTLEAPRTVIEYKQNLAYVDKYEDEKFYADRGDTKQIETSCFLLSTNVQNIKTPESSYNNKGWINLSAKLGWAFGGFTKAARELLPKIERYAGIITANSPDADLEISKVLKAMDSGRIVNTGLKVSRETANPDPGLYHTVKIADEYGSPSVKSFADTIDFLTKDTYTPTFIRGENIDFSWSPKPMKISDVYVNINNITYMDEAGVNQLGVFYVYSGTDSNGRTSSNDIAYAVIDFDAGLPPVGLECKKGTTREEFGDVLINAETFSGKLVIPLYCLFKLDEDGRPERRYFESPKDYFDSAITAAGISENTFFTDLIKPCVAWLILAAAMANQGGRVKTEIIHFAKQQKRAAAMVTTLTKLGQKVPPLS